MKNLLYLSVVKKKKVLTGMKAEQQIFSPCLKNKKKLRRLKLVLTNKI